VARGRSHSHRLKIGPSFRVRGRGTRRSDAATRRALELAHVCKTLGVSVEGLTPGCLRV
jgi:hypothetical protein